MSQTTKTTIQIAGAKLVPIDWVHATGTGAEAGQIRDGGMIWTVFDQDRIWSKVETRRKI